MKAFIKKWWWVIAYLIGYYIVITAVVVNRWNQYEMTYFDHGIYDHAIWKVAHFQLPLIDHTELKPLNQLGDHFSILMYLFVPLYWFTSSYQLIFFVQNLIVVASIAIIVKIAWRKLQSRWAVGMILVSSTLFIGLQNALIGDFHADIFGMLPFALLLDYLDQKKWKHYYCCLALLLLGKESYALIASGMTIYIWFNCSRKHAIYTVLIAISYFYITTNLLMPWLAQRQYQYTDNLPHFSGAIERLFLPLIKTKTMFVSLLTFGLLPLLSASFIPVILQDWIMRFVFNDAGTRFDLGMHYNSMITISLAYGAIVSIGKLHHFHWFKKIIPVISLGTITIAIFIHRFWYHGPLGLASNSTFYKHSQDFKFLDTFISQIPQGELVMAPNNLAVRLTHTNEVMLSRKNYWTYMPSIIVMDMRSGQNPNHYWPLSPEDWQQTYQQITKDPNYEIERIGNDQVIFHKRQTVDMKIYSF